MVRGSFLSLLAVVALTGTLRAAPPVCHVDVYVSGQDGYTGYRIPALETAPDGSLLAFAEARKNNFSDPGGKKQDIDLVMKRSTDGGATWSAMTVIEDAGENWSAANPATVVDRQTGRVWVLYLRSKPGCGSLTSRPGTDDLQTLARWSDDNGQTWSEPIDLTAVARDMADPQWRASVVGPGGMIQDSKGRLIAAVWRVLPWGVFTIYSDDHGRTWQRGEIVPQDGLPQNYSPNETQVVELSDGRILMDYRDEKAAHRWMAESRDGGRTWATPRPGNPATPVACAIERYTQKSAGDDRNRIVWTGPKGPKRQNLVVRVSYDDGQTFPEERLIAAEPAAYSDLAILKDKSVGVLWERQDYKQITFTQLTREFLQSPSIPQEPSLPGVVLDERVEALPGLPMGPFVRLKDGGILTVDMAQNAMLSHDEGKTWKSFPVFAEPAKYAIRVERALIVTREGTVILAFMNDKERANWHWDKTISDSPDAQLPTYAVRSLDGGKTWQPPQKLHDDWTGAIRDMIQTEQGTIVFTSMMMRHNPGRHSVVTYASKDEGKTWIRSNIIDLGGVGHHGGVTEATLEQLTDGRLWLLLRTNWKTFWEAFSSDEGLTWHDARATKIDASSAPGLLKRLASGRLVLIWNRYFPEGKTDFPLSGGDHQWSEVPVSNHRLELSMMFSDDDGKTWTSPVVIARATKGELSYPYLFEARPGELWLTVMRGVLRAKLLEKDFVGK